MDAGLFTGGVDAWTHGSGDPNIMNGNSTLVTMRGVARSAPPTSRRPQLMSLVSRLRVTTNVCSRPMATGYGSDAMRGCALDARQVLPRRQDATLCAQI